MFFEIIFVKVELVVLLRNFTILSSCKSTLKPNIVSRPDLLLKTYKTHAFNSSALMHRAWEEFLMFLGMKTIFFYTELRNETSNGKVFAQRRKSSLCFPLVAPSSCSWIFAAVAMVCCVFSSGLGLDAWNRPLPLYLTLIFLCFVFSSVSLDNTSCSSFRDMVRINY